MLDVMNYISTEEREQMEKDTRKLMLEIEDNIPYIIAKINIVQFALINAEHEYQLRKNDYEIKFNRLTLGETYAKKFKTIKAREQQATIDLKENKTEIQNMKTTKDIYKAELERLRNQLKLLMIYEENKHE